MYARVQVVHTVPVPAGPVYRKPRCYPYPCGSHISSATFRLMLSKSKADGPVTLFSYICAATPRSWHHTCKPPRSSTSHSFATTPCPQFVAKLVPTSCNFFLGKFPSSYCSRVDRMHSLRRRTPTLWELQLTFYPGPAVEARGASRPHPNPSLRIRPFVARIH